MEHQDPFDYDAEDEENDDDPTELDLPSELPVPHAHLYDLFLFMSKSNDEQDSVMNLIRYHMNELYDAFEDDFPERDLETLGGDVVAYLCRRHKWNVELLWDRKDAEEMLFRKYNSYDPNIWEKIMETDSLREMHRSVYEVTQKYLSDAIEEVISPNNRKKRKQRFGKRRGNR